MPTINADFTKISSSNEPVDAGEYVVQINEIEEGVSETNKTPYVNCTLEIQDPRHPQYEGRYLYDRCFTATKEGKINRMGLGRIKAYAEATLGEEAANSPHGIDTDAMKGSKVIVVVAQRQWEKKDPTTGETTDSGVSNDIKKVLRVD